MSLDEAIYSNKKFRKLYRKSKAFDKTCRNHGDCSLCEGNRTHRNKVREEEAEDQMKNWKKINWSQEYV